MRPAYREFLPDLSSRVLTCVTRTFHPSGRRARDECPPRLSSHNRCRLSALPWPSINLGTVCVRGPQTETKLALKRLLEHILLSLGFSYLTFTVQPASYLDV